VAAEPEYIWSDRQKAEAGVFDFVDHYGFAVMRGLIRREDMKAKKPDDEEVNPGETEQPTRPCFL
jgi:hypothetical protein